ncbi:MAG: 2-succinyl-5-enolpyruvyl-6-hydroxy-3-cyclohexene-1-carboxylic-acid synthase [Halodesulfurarchaeum sp.]
MSGPVPPNRNVLWATIIVTELEKAGVKRAIVAPGSRSTPLAVALADAPGITTQVHLDERSAGFFALGQGKRSGRPTVVLTTSGTAAANLHPAVIEAGQSRTPLVALTADRPPELHDSGANQTIDQENLYGSAVRFFRTLPEPEPRERKLRSLRTIVARAVAASIGSAPGPVHLNVPFRKPLDPVEVPEDVPPELFDSVSLGTDGRDGPYVAIDSEPSRPGEKTVSEVSDAVVDTSRGLLVVGPMNPDIEAVEAIVGLADATGFPVLADPLSGLRFGDHVDEVQVLGGYDGYLGAESVAAWPDPDLVVRFGASPTSKSLRQYLRDRADRQILVDPAGEWREATFTASDLIRGAPSTVASALATAIATDSPQESPTSPSRSWSDRFARAESTHWETVEEVVESKPTGAVEAEPAGALHEGPGLESEETTFEGTVLTRICRAIPNAATLFVSNSTPVRDLDRFGAPRQVPLTVLGNRGASGIDGITSSGLGAGSVTDDPLILVTGDLAFFHDTNGLLALDRFDLEATIVLINNDGGGIFHRLPIEEFDPPFESFFKTPHGLDFSSTGSMYDFEFERVDSPDPFESSFRKSIERPGTQVLEVRTDAERSQRIREALLSRVGGRLVE